MQKWFLLGVSLAMLAVFVSAYLFFSSPAVRLLQPDQVVLDVIGMCAVWLVMWLGTRMTGGRYPQRQRPHRLFTPLYDRR